MVTQYAPFLATMKIDKKANQTKLDGEEIVKCQDLTPPLF